MPSRMADTLLQFLFVSILLSLFNNIAFAVDSFSINNQLISKQRRAELHNLLIQDCGSCHGMTMKGGLGPALTSEILKNKSREMIEVTILNGRSGTPMPPWNTILTKQEIHWLVDILYAGDLL